MGILRPVAVGFVIVIGLVGWRVDERRSGRAVPAVIGAPERRDLVVQIERVPPDAQVAEGWERITDTPEVRGVGSTRWLGREDWAWQVSVDALEFIREDPLESELRGAIELAIRSASGVVDVTEEDRENWSIDGSPDGRALVEATALVLDQYAPRIGDHIDELNERARREGR